MTDPDPDIPAARLMIVVTSGATAASFVSGFAGYLAGRGHRVRLVADSIDAQTRIVTGPRLSTRSISMDRKPNLARDALSLVRLIGEVRRYRPDVLAYATPKASLLASIASFVCRVPTRTYLLWGLRLETVNGWGRRILALAERLTSHLSTSVIANSPSLAERYRQLGLGCHTAVECLGHGSSHGVDLERFEISADRPPVDQQTAEFLNANQGCVIGYVGRLHPDKGLDTLLAAAGWLGASRTPIRLLLVGRDEGAGLDEQIKSLPRPISVHVVGRVADPRPYYAAMDVLVLVSRREGFPNVVLEAAAMGVPAVVSDATGAVDSVVDGVTGRMVPVGDSRALAEALAGLSDDPASRKRLGRQARERVVRDFAQNDVWASHHDYLLRRHRA